MDKPFPGAFMRLSCKDRMAKFKKATDEVLLADPPSECSTWPRSSTAPFPELDGPARGPARSNIAYKSGAGYDARSSLKSAK